MEDLSMISQKRKCGYCASHCIWIWEGGFYKDGSKIYLNDKKKRWAGKRCPPCERKRVKCALQYSTLEKSFAFKELARHNFIVKSNKYPFLVEKEGKEYQVGIQFAHTNNGKIILDSVEKNENLDFVVLIFKNARLISKKAFCSL